MTAKDGSDSSSDFALNSARLYISGKATDNIGFMFNTEYNSDDETIRVIDAAAQFSFSGGKHNIWAGRFLPPSDRANLYGPYYASNWGVYQDGVQDGYPFETEGRDDGVMYWGQYDKVKFSIGAFDVTSLTTGDSDVLLASRVQVDFWDKEDGYYLNGTYYGEKDLLAIGLAAQTADAGDAYTFDFLLEKKLGNSGVITVESEYSRVRRARRLRHAGERRLREVGRLLRARRLSVRRAKPVPASSSCSPSMARPPTTSSVPTSTRTRWSST